MSWLGSLHFGAALLCLVVCGLLALAGPRLVAALPEPAPEPAPEPVPDPVSVPDAVEGVPVGAGERDTLFSRTLAPAPTKEPYAAIAALPGLGLRLAVGSAVVGAAFGAVLGWTGALLYLVPLVPVGAVLLVIDWRTTLLPTRILHRTYALLAVLLPVAALVDHDLSSLYRAGWGWAVVGGWFWVLWALLRAWGFGDVRLARVLGPALGYLGWEQMLVGLALIVLVGGLGGVVLSVATRSLRRRFPYGPFMLVGATGAVLVGPWLARGLGY